MADENENSEEMQNAKNEKSENISIPKGDYISLMTKLAVLEDKLERGLTKEEPKKEEVQPLATKDIDLLTNSELLQLFSTNVNEKVVQPLLNQIMQLSVKNEIRDLGDTYSDFKTNSSVREAVFKIAEKNSNLSLEQAYLIHVGKNPASKQEEKKTVTLPISEKVNLSTKQMNNTKPMSLREAAQKAFDSLKYTDAEGA